MSHITLSHQDVPSLGGTIWQYQLPLVWAMQFSDWVERDLSYNRWWHWPCHPVVSWHNYLNMSCVEQAIVCPAAAIHKCEHNSTDFDPDVEFWVRWDWQQLQHAPIQFGRFIKLNNIIVKVLYKQANIGFAAEAVFLGGGGRGRFTQKKGVTLLPWATDFWEKNSPQAPYVL